MTTHSTDPPQPVSELLDAGEAMDHQIDCPCRLTGQVPLDCECGVTRLRAAAAAVRTEQALIVKTHLNLTGAIIGWLDQHGMELTDAERSEFTGQLAYHLEQAARAALKPIATPGILPDRLEQLAEQIENSPTVGRSEDVHGLCKLAGQIREVLS